MASTKIGLLFFLLLGMSDANLINRNMEWKPGFLDHTFEEVRSDCDTEVAPLECMKVKLMYFINTVLNKDTYQLTEDIVVQSNGRIDKARSNTDFFDYVINYLRRHDVTMKVPIFSSEVTISSRNMDTGELDIKLKLPEEPNRSMGQGRRSKIKKFIMPIMVLVLLKAMTVIPLAIGMLGLKAFNALQLGFVSFLVSAGLAIFQICKKLAVEHHQSPHIISPHVHWDSRSFSNEVDDHQKLAYNAYVSYN